MLAQIALLSPPFSVLDYHIPAWYPENLLSPGLRVAVPLGKSGQIRSGYLIGYSQSSKPELADKIKDIIWPLETQPILNEDLLELSKNLSLKLALQPGIIYGHCLPAGLRSTSIKFALESGNFPSTLTIREIRQLPDPEKAKLLKDFFDGKIQVISPSEDKSALEIWSLAVDPPWKLRSGAKRQLALLNFLMENGSSSRKKLSQHFGAPVGEILHNLLEKGFLKKEFAQEMEMLPVKRPEALKLNEEQKTAFNELCSLLEKNEAACHLLHGITGSGKTAVYLELARKSLQWGKSVLLLAPEVALAHKLFQVASSSLPDSRVCLFHGYQNPVSREKTFLRLAHEKAPSLVVGTRSALYLPLHSPGLIILDEEHDASFKQDETFAYHAREAAWQRAVHNRALLVLGSATPDIRTFYAASQGSIGLSSLTKRAGQGRLPEVRLLKLNPEVYSRSVTSTASLLTAECENALADCVKRGEQAIILHNRRGYSPLMFCPSCSKTVHCPNCDVALAWHKNINKLICHYCGYSRPYPSPCPVCGRINLMPLGEGTEKLEEKLQTIACQPVLRLDRDNARRKGKLEEIMDAFAFGASPFLVGTQMISKGHHFPNVTLVVVADGDLGLNMPDYRAAERTFQLLVQTSGRAGRGEKPGQVLIQTRNPDHYCWEFILKNDYTGFYKQELEKRKKYLYPPFTKLALLRLSTAETGERLSTSLNSIAKELKKVAAALKIFLLGPAPAPVATIRKQKRFHFLLKGSSWEKMRILYFHALKQPEAKIFRLFLDLDPVNML